MVSKAQIKAQTKWEAKVYDKITLRTKKDSDISREAITAAATAAGESLNEYILESVRERMTSTSAKG